MVGQSLQSKCNGSSSATRGSPVDTRVDTPKHKSIKTIFSFAQNPIHLESRSISTRKGAHLLLKDASPESTHFSWLRKQIFTRITPPPSLSPFTLEKLVPLQFQSGSPFPGLSHSFRGRRSVHWPVLPTEMQTEVCWVSGKEKQVSQSWALWKAKQTAWEKETEPQAHHWVTEPNQPGRQHLLRIFQ